VGKRHNHIGRVQLVVLASDFDALREKAVRLRKMIVNRYGCLPDCACDMCTLLLNTADLEVTP
jgi:hypothetical protein